MIWGIGNHFFPKNLKHLKVFNKSGYPYTKGEFSFTLDTYKKIYLRHSGESYVKEL
jgi:hypothetical protein